MTYTIWFENDDVTIGQQDVGQIVHMIKTGSMTDVSFVYI